MAIDEKYNENIYPDDVPAEVSEVSGEEPAVYEDIYSSKKVEARHKIVNDIIIARLRHFRKELTVDFDKPFSFTDQFIIMSVMLVVSILLFGTIFLVHSCVSPVKDQSVDNIGVLQVEVAPSGEASRKEEELEVDSSSTQISNGHEESSDVSDVEESVKEQVFTNPYFSVRTEVVDNSGIHNGDLVLVNKECKCYTNGENVVPLIETGSLSYALTDNSVSLDKNVAGYLNRMMDSFYDLYGDTRIMIACGFRSMETQARLYNDEISRLGNKKGEMWVAPPEFSEHQTGLAFDFNIYGENEGGIQYSGESIYSWLNDNCFRYGFIVRYPLGKEKITGYEYEAWHFRYVGEPSAIYMTQNDYTLEEYQEMLCQHDVNKPIEVIAEDGRRWCIYRVEASDHDNTLLPVPENGEYSVSGDNVNGFIVTVPLFE